MTNDSFCINPVCSKPNHPNNHKNRFCQSCGSQLELLGRYRVTHLLDSTTGLATIYEAYEQDNIKILKVLKENLSLDTKAVENFRQEAVILGQLNHPGIPKADSYFQHQTRNGLILHCIVMEKIVGVNLEDWIQKQHKPISETLAIKWLKQITEILNLVHSKSYLHLDIKPANILLKPNGDLILTNFGTNKIYQNATTTPTLLSGYTAPEQMNGQAATQSDFFSLGRTFVFFLTGKHPLDMYDVRQNLLHWRNHTKGISPDLLNLIDWLIAPELKNRPTHTRYILQRLDDIERQAISKKYKSSKAYELTQIKSNLHLIPLFAALTVSLGLLLLVAIFIDYPNFSVLPLSTQAPEKKGKIDYFPYAEGRDSQGRTAKFNIAILSVQYKWLTRSNFQIKNNDTIISLDFLKLALEQERIQEIMDNPNEIIAVGTADCDRNQALAENLALERSQQVDNLAKKLFKNTPTVKGYRLLNLGQLQQKNCQDGRTLTRYQRNVIIIGFKKESKAVILDEALRDRLKNKPFADFNLDDYSLGTADKFKTIPSK